MTKPNTVINIINIPVEYNKRDDVSIFSLIEESGYFNAHDQITYDDIRAAIVEYPESVNAWLQYSEDKRSSDGWYFKPADQGYEVGFFGQKMIDRKHQIYSNRLEACAVFIKNEIEAIRQGR